PTPCTLSCPLPTPSLYTPSLHDALPIFTRHHQGDVDAQAALPYSSDGSRLGRPWSERLRLTPTRFGEPALVIGTDGAIAGQQGQDRKSTRLNSSHVSISYAVF